MMAQTLKVLAVPIVVLMGAFFGRTAAAIPLGSNVIVANGATQAPLLNQVRGGGRGGGFRPMPTYRSQPSYNPAPRSYTAPRAPSPFTNRPPTASMRTQPAWQTQSGQAAWQPPQFRGSIGQAVPWRQLRPWHTLAPTQARFGLVAAQANRAQSILGLRNSTSLSSRNGTQFGLSTRTGTAYGLYNYSQRFNYLRPAMATYVSTYGSRSALRRADASARSTSHRDQPRAALSSTRHDTIAGGGTAGSGVGSTRGAASAGVSSASNNGGMMGRGSLSARFNQASTSAVKTHATISLPPSAKRASGTTVLGQHPKYVVLSTIAGARSFQMPMQHYLAMPKLERWRANRKFLDRAIARNDKILVVSDPSKAKPESPFAMEIAYMRSKGYNLVPEGNRFVLKR